MKKSYLILAAIAITGMVSCSSEDFVGESTGQPTGETTISFGSQFKAVTRAEYTGATAADMLGKQFYVSGFKGDKSDYVTAEPTNADDPIKSVLTFDNFQVVWEENTANTTESNTRNWEYVGKTPKDGSNATSQKVKYWDFGKKQYDFIAYSLGNTTGVTASLINPANLKTAAYTLSGPAEQLKDCYIADLVTVKKANYESGPVTIKFRNLSAKVRLALYETVPGYKVTGVKFYNAAEGSKSTDATLFSEVGYFSTNGTYTIYYPTLDITDPDDSKFPDNNVAHVTYSGDKGTTGAFGTLHYNSSGYLGETSSSPTYAGDYDKNYYTIVLPNESGAALNLKVDFTLVSDDGLDEEITVTGATAQVPATYSQWQAGTAYTYIFKISKDFNGTTGTPGTGVTPGDPTGLYPITFDAMVVTDEDINGQVQETITTVATPSITTYSRGEIVTNYDEYFKNNDIFVTVSELNALATLTGKAALYTITPGKIESDILAALQMRELDRIPDGVTIKGRNGVELTSATLSLTDKYVGPDGIDKTVGTDEVAKFKPTAADTYAFVYTQSDATTSTDMFEVQTFTTGDAVKGYYCNYEYVEQANMDAVLGKTYFTRESSTDTYTVVADADYPFVGQFATGLYTKHSNTQYKKVSSASQRLQSGVTYYLAPATVTTGYKIGTSAVGLGLYTATGDPSNPTYEEVTSGTIEGTITYYTFDGTSYTAVTTGTYDYGYGESATSLYKKSGSYLTQATGTITAGTTYYKAPDEATLKKFTEFGTSLYKKVGGVISAVESTDKPSDAIEYYTTSEGTTRAYILPKQTNEYYIMVNIDVDIQNGVNPKACPAGETALAGKTYYDRYVVNNGVYAVKVIKVQ